MALNRKWVYHNPSFEVDGQVHWYNYSTSPWGENRHFGYDLVSFLRPSRIVELGSYMGCSLFTFAQAIKDKGLNTKIIGVDHWKGDVQSGYYDGDSTFSEVGKLCREFFPFVDLLREPFEEALRGIKNNSINLLHIDGSHDYMSVLSDYQSWLPKLKTNGVILLHDSAHLEWGVSELVTSLRWNVKVLEITNQNGLAIVFPKGDFYLNKMINAGFNVKKY